MSKKTAKMSPIEMMRKIAMQVREALEVADGVRKPTVAVGDQMRLFG